MNGLKLLLLGSSGFIGRNLKEAWQDRHALSAPTHRELDLLDTEAVEAFLRKNAFDAVVLSANTNNITHPERAARMLEYNLRMFCNLERCHALYGKLLYFGSGAEYDGAHYIPRMPEAYFARHIPGDPYGFSKYVMAKAAERSENIYDLCLFGVFGKYEEWKRRFISNMIYQAFTGTEMRMDRHMYFDYLYVEDLAEILEWFFCHEPEYHRYNICTGRRMDLADLARIVKEETETKAEIVLTGDGWKPPYTGDNTRLLRELGRYTFTPTREAVGKMVAFYRQNGFAQ